MLSSISGTGASATASQSGKRATSDWYARPEFVSDVFCDSSVNTSSATGSPCTRQAGIGASASSRSMISSGVRRRFARVARRLPLPDRRPARAFPRALVFPALLTALAR